MAARARAVPDLLAAEDAAAVGRHRRRVARRLADHRQAAGRRALPERRLGHWRVQGDPRRRPCLRPHDRARRAAPARRAVRARPLHHRRARSTSTAPPPWRTERHAADPLPVVRRRATKSSSATAARRISSRAAEPGALDDAAWADYLFMRNNPKGVFAERWVHQAGCRRWFNLLRDTVSHRIIAVYKIGEQPARQGRFRRRPVTPGIPPGAGRADRPRPDPAVFTSTASATRAIPATRWPRRCWRTACGWSGAASSIHRPRGHFHRRVRGAVGAGPAETALTEPNRRATEIALYDGLVATSQHAWPSAALRCRRRPPGGSRRCCRPGSTTRPSSARRRLWQRLWEPLLRRMAGLGRAPREPDPARYDKTHAHCDVLVVGGGPAGLAAALAAGRSGARVILAEADRELGGSLLRRPGQVDVRWLDWPASVAELAALPRSPRADRHDRLRPLRRQLPRSAAASDGAPASASGTSAPAASCWRPGRSNGRWCFPATTGRGSCWPARSRPTSIALPWRRAAARCCSPTTTMPITPPRRSKAAGVAVAAIVDLRAEPGVAARALADGIALYLGHAVIGTTGRARLCAEVDGPPARRRQDHRGSPATCWRCPAAGTRRSICLLTPRAGCAMTRALPPLCRMRPMRRCSRSAQRGAASALPLVSPRAPRPAPAPPRRAAFPPSRLPLPEIAAEAEAPPQALWLVPGDHGPATALSICTTTSPPPISRWRRARASPRSSTSSARPRSAWAPTRARPAMSPGSRCCRRRSAGPSPRPARRRSGRPMCRSRSASSPGASAGSCSIRCG